MCVCVYTYILNIWGTPSATTTTTYMMKGEN